MRLCTHQNTHTHTRLIHNLRRLIIFHFGSKSHESQQKATHLRYAQTRAATIGAPVIAYITYMNLVHTLDETQYTLKHKFIHTYIMTHYICLLTPHPKFNQNLQQQILISFSIATYSLYPKKRNRNKNSS